jgi:hypothetical protein
MRRVKIIEAIKERLDILSNSHNILVWPIRPLNDSDYPAIIIRDTSSNVSLNSTGQNEHTLTILIEILISGSIKENITEKARNLAAGVIEIFMEDDGYLFLEPTRSLKKMDLAVNMAETALAGVNMAFEVKYTTLKNKI